MIVVITGPTATGKSETAIKVAKHIDADILNGDAYQIYKELNIGVAKPSEEMLREVKHYLYSYFSIKDEYSIFQYQKDAREIIEDHIANNRNLVIVGGSMLYIRAAIFDYNLEENAAKLNYFDEKYASYSNEELHDILKNIDPKEADVLHPNNRRRVLRAIEIYELNGVRKSEIVDAQNHAPIYKDVYFFSPKYDRSELYEKANKRVDLMIEKGLVDEAYNLFDNYPNDLKSLQAIGYKELLLSYRKEIELPEAIELIKKNTRNYIKRQNTFVKHQFKDVYYYDNDEEILEALKDKING